MSEIIPADGKNVLLFRHQEIQENLDVNSIYIYKSQKSFPNENKCM